MQQQIDMRAMRDQIVTLTARPTYAQSECDIGLGPEHQCFEELDGSPRFRGRVSPAGSQMSTTSTSRFPSTVHKHLHNIKRTVEALSHLEGQGSKQISANLVELRQNRKELDAAVAAADLEGDFPETVRFEVENILEAAPALEIKAAIRQDELEAQEKTERVDLQQRPRLRFSIFSGEPESFDIF